MPMPPFLKYDYYGAEHLYRVIEVTPIAVLYRGMSPFRLLPVCQCFIWRGLTLNEQPDLKTNSASHIVQVLTEFARQRKLYTSSIESFLYYVFKKGRY